MAGRGRGRGGGNSFKDINERIGLPAGGPAAGEAPVESVLEPPPLFPPLESRPVPLDLGVEGEYLLALKRDFVEYFHDSPSYLQDIVVKADIQRYSDRYQTATLASRTTADLVCDWTHFPKELKDIGSKPRRKRKLKSSKGNAKVPRKAEDIINRLEELEKQEEGSDAEGEVETDGKKVDNNDEIKDADSEAGEEVDEEDLDEEMDDGTDYRNSHFDNGEDYIDEEEDNLDDGPVY
ncbi:hypothetical protein ONE63_007588 [Megalurothrips usitatus]|uniref:DNA-directed RNA polymerase III subunit n=1 Tax=Megalurothrips usitatus TaxID=439358 RepID=A0AAV7XV33_9NEOP|nr:hypothetical protein ONE63_007588 [Megalurothrips usitatus]